MVATTARRPEHPAHEPLRASHEERTPPPPEAYHVWLQDMQGAGAGWADVPPLEGEYQRRDAALDAQGECEVAWRHQQWPVQAVRAREPLTPADVLLLSGLMVAVGWLVFWLVPYTAALGGGR